MLMSTSSYLLMVCVQSERLVLHDYIEACMGFNLPLSQLFESTSRYKKVSTLHFRAIHSKNS